jgi:hypothetical protein
MSASAYTTNSGDSPVGLAKPSVNRAEPLKCVASTTVMSVRPQKIAAKPTNTRKNHTAWNASSVTGGRIASTLSRNS